MQQPQQNQSKIVETNLQASSSSNIITLDTLINSQLNIRDQVFRPGNVPTMTLDEFADKEKAFMEEQQRLQEENKPNEEDEDSENEEVGDRKTKKAREWDDWKDSVEKGIGNKMRR